MTGSLRRWAVPVGLLLQGCAVGLAVPQGTAAPEPALTAAQARRVARLRARVQGAPGEVAPRRAAGLELMWLALAGHRSLQAEAESHLEAALRAAPGDKTLARALGRFYNMRTVSGDTSKAREQVWAYDLLLGDAARSPAELTDRGFVAWTFARMGEALVRYNEGRLLAALAVVRGLERALARRVRRHPQDVELRALAGNFAFFFAGHLPVGKRRRIRAGVEHFTYVRQHWDAMRAGARDPRRCPNTRENFMFELAEGRLALGDVAGAAAVYRELAARPPGTPARAQIAAVSRGRLGQLQALSGDLRLMPPWPSDADNCVVCHAHRAEVSPRTLYAPPANFGGRGL